jgi:hypothetical protein
MEIEDDGYSNNIQPKRMRTLLTLAEERMAAGLEGPSRGQAIWMQRGSSFTVTETRLELSGMERIWPLTEYAFTIIGTLLDQPVILLIL